MQSWLTDGASNIIQQEVNFSPGGTTGWHTHPGIVLLTLAADSGPVDWYDSKCGKTVYRRRRLLDGGNEAP